jgi:leader peptidase (prepilin peptidase)/N-methyltransferase
VFESYDPSILIAAAGVLGLIVGSFLNVVILRLPPRLEFAWQAEAREALGLEPEAAGKAPPGLVREASHCPKCGTPIRWYDNVPVIGYVMLRGRCRQCGVRISPQYPLVELGTGIATALCVWRFGATVAGGAAMALTWALIALAGIDFRTQLLPDKITLPLLWLGLLLSLVPLFALPTAAIVGAAVGYLSLWSVYWAFKLLTGKEGMGYGDFKLLGALGAWFGVAAVLPIILLSSVVGALLGGLMIAVRGRDSQLPMPFGPFLAAAGYVYMIAGPQLQQWLPMFTPH